jgi:Zn-dependent M16 (insulinase) family peptidase
VSNFRVLGREEVGELGLVLIRMVHGPTGATHYHIHRDDPSSVFCIAFRTPPADSTGVPHILEHTVLCGSRKFPVRDPFFKMLNRSLASYMNAWTASEHTAYPFCTANPKDYANLRDVYCDAVFSPALARSDFLQEGWRVEHADPSDAGSPLTFKGVVYNEMKGALSDSESLFATRLQQHLFPGSTYSHVSGGDPPRIVDLTHDQLVAFHRRHYHPSNALIYTYGKFPLAESLEYLDGRLSAFNKAEAVPIQVPVDAPVPRGGRVELACPLDPSTCRLCAGRV